MDVVCVTKSQIQYNITHRLRHVSQKFDRKFTGVAGKAEIGEVEAALTITLLATLLASDGTLPGDTIIGALRGCCSSAIKDKR